MPSSTNKHLTFITNYIRKINPKSILDCGVGFGKWGFLCREYLDVFSGRVFPDEWTIKIHGIEIFSPYLDRFPWLYYFYDQIFEGDILSITSDLVKKGVTYDLGIAGDVIEHLDKESAIKTIDNLKKICYNLIISIPIGDVWLNNKIVANNKHEKHLSSWSYGDFIKIFEDNFIAQDWQENRKPGLVLVWSK